MNAITQNPYRVLGMFANDSVKVMTANIAKIRAYLKVGRICEFENDYPEIFGKVNRSEEAIEEAIKNLASEEDNCYYSLLWLHRTDTLPSKPDDIDDIINSAISNDFDNIVNKLVCATSRGFYGLIAIYYINLLNLDENISEVCRRKLLHTLIWHTNPQIQFKFWVDCKNACEKIYDQKRNNIYGYLSDDFNQLAINRLRSEISLSTLHKDFPKWKNLENIHKWAKFTIDLLKESSNPITLVPNAESQLVLSDYADVMLKACQRFHADSRFKNASEAEDLLNILRDLFRISYKSKVKEECTEFGKKVKELVKYLAPESVRAQSKTIQNEIEKFCDKSDEVRWSLLLLRNCIESLIEIKDVLDSNNSYYQRISSQIAENALYSADIELSSAIRKYNNPTNDKEQARIYLRNIIAKCGVLISDIYQLDIEREFDEYKAKPFLKRIRDLMTEFEVDDALTMADISLMSDSDKLAECGNDYEKLRTFVIDNPNSPQLQEAMKRIWEIEYNEFPSSVNALALFDYKQKFPNSHNDQRILNLLNQLLLGTSNGSLMEYRKLLRLWPNHPKKAIIEGRIDLINFKNCVCAGDWEDYLKSFPNGQHRVEAQRKIEEEKFNQCQTISDFNRFILNYPTSAFFDLACSKIEGIIYINALRNREYSQYLSQYPNGEYAAEIREKQEYQIFKETIAKGDYLQYYKAYPKGKYTSEVRKAEDEAFFNKCKDYKDYKNYLRKYPHGIYKNDAQKQVDKHRNKILMTWGLGICALALMIIICWSQSSRINKADSELGQQVEQSSANQQLDISNVDKQGMEENFVNESIVDDSNESPYRCNSLSTGSRPYRSYFGRSLSGGHQMSFKTGSGSDYVVIVKRYGNRQYVDHLYIKGGDYASMNLPDGTFDVYFYSGNGWNPYKLNGECEGGFVENAAIQKDGPVTLQRRYEGDYYYDQTLSYTLYPVYNGNLTLQGASEKEAF